MLDIRQQQPYLWSMTFDTEETPTARLQNPLAGPTMPPRAPMFAVSRLVPVLGEWADELPTRPGDSILCVLRGAA
jgi:hypothetical protein